MTVWLPFRSRPRGPQRWPVLYLNDGQNLFDPGRAFAGNTWGVQAAAARLVRARRIPPLVIVGIDHAGVRRGLEYLPVKDERNQTDGAPIGDAYADFVVREVMPVIARTYPVAAGASHTGFGGSSYGAIAALHTALTNPGVFGKLLLESPSLYVGGEALLRRARTATRWPRRIYLGVGTAETRDPERSTETVTNVLKLAATLRRAGLGTSRLRLVVEEGATHSEGAWAARLPHALEFLFTEK